MSRLYSEIDSPIIMYDAFGSAKVFKVENHIVECSDEEVPILLQLPYVRLIEDDELVPESGEDDSARAHRPRRGGARE